MRRAENRADQGRREEPTGAYDQARLRRDSVPAEVPATTDAGQRPKAILGGHPRSGSCDGYRHGARTLIYIPIIHTQADMGKLASSVRRVTVQKLGGRAWKRNVDVIGRMWEEIRRKVEGWELPWEKVRLYQDGLPRCGRETEIVNDLAGAGSPNHQLLLSLMKKGATLMGTESPDLLLEEYRLVQEILAAKDPEEAARIEASHEALSRSLLARRDQYIARRINETLRDGETGILFLGMLHSLDSRLAKDIRVTYPILRPPRLMAQTK